MALKPKYTLTTAGYFQRGIVFWKHNLVFPVICIRYIKIWKSGALNAQVPFVHSFIRLYPYSERVWGAVMNSKAPSCPHHRPFLSHFFDIRAERLIYYPNKDLYFAVLTRISSITRISEIDQKRNLCSYKWTIFDHTFTFNLTTGS